MPLIESQGLTLVGVAVANLDDERAVQLTLPFDRDDEGALDTALDEVRDRFGTRRDHARRCCSAATRACRCRCCPTEPAGTIRERDDTLEIETPHGPARAHLHPATSRARRSCSVTARAAA